MSNKFSRHQSVISRQSDENNSEDHWFQNFQKSLQKDAVQPRNVDSSLFDQINSIMNGKSRYTSVDHAVQDMQERSGLTAYLNKIKVSEVETTNEDIGKTASIDDWFGEGVRDGAEDLEKDQAGDIVASLNSLYKKPPIQYALNYGMGYCKGAKFNEEITNKELSTLKKVIERYYAKKYSADKQPADVPKKKVPVVFEKCPQIKKTLENYIKDSKGNLPIPAIIDKLRSIHQKDVSDSKDWDDENLIKEVSKQNLMAKRDNPASYENYANLGSRDRDNNTDIDSSNTDAFHALMPAKQ